MSMDFNGRDSDKPVTDEEGVMFAAQPVWDRNRKRKGFGGRKTASTAAEPRTFADTSDAEIRLDRPVEAPPAAAPAYPRTEYAAMNPMAGTQSQTSAERNFDRTDEPVGLAAPIGGTRNTRQTKSNSVAPAAIAATVIGLGALAAGGWYMSREPEGVPELATAAPVTSEMAAAPLTPVAPPAQLAMNEATPPAATPAQPRAAPAVRTPARVRPAAASSAGEAGVNASTTAALPSGPQAYAPSTGAAPAPAEMNPPLLTLPSASAAPAAVPATPPVATPEPAPATESPDPATPSQ